MLRGGGRVRRVLRRGAEGGEVTVVVGHGHVMHVAAVAVVVAARGGEMLIVSHFLGSRVQGCLNPHQRYDETKQ